MGPCRALLHSLWFPAVPCSIWCGCGAGSRAWLSGSHQSQPNHNDGWRKAQHVGYGHDRERGAQSPRELAQRCDTDDKGKPHSEEAEAEGIRSPAYPFLLHKAPVGSGYDKKGSHAHNAPGQCCHDSPHHAPRAAKLIAGSPPDGDTQCPWRVLRTLSNCVGGVLSCVQGRSPGGVLLCPGGAQPSCASSASGVVPLAGGALMVTG